MVAELHSTPAGCVALKFHKKSPAEPRECGCARLLADLISAGD
ncbi:hypothetical protein SAMN05446934_6542 [Paraburkholderia hospita]|nr:hypothetical protein SAMN05446934_6542 [Paraburkholderia hospita]